jgi:hypothetical protein
MDESTNDVLNSLESDLRLEASAARGEGDRPTAAVLDRLANAIMRNVDRRRAAELADSQEA